MKRYALGFMFNFSLQKVLLMRYTKPADPWHRLNGVGGRCFTAEDAAKSLYSIFTDQVGIRHRGWIPVGQVGTRLSSVMDPQAWRCSYFTCIGDISKATPSEFGQPVVVDMLKLREQAIMPSLPVMLSACELKLSAGPTGRTADINIDYMPRTER